MADNTDKKSTSALSDGSEYRVLASLFGVMLGCAGLLAGTMMYERSLDYWMEDIVPLLILALSSRGLLKNSMELARESMVYAEQQKVVQTYLAAQNELLEAEHPDLPQIASKKKYSEAEVLEAVSKRIQEQREKAVKHNKLVN